MRNLDLSSSAPGQAIPVLFLRDLGTEALLHFGWEALADPAETFPHPRDVLASPQLSRAEKRSILASWASDAFAVEAAPALRQVPGGRPVLLDDIMEALRSIDASEEPELAS